MPACDMSASIEIRAPLIGFPAASASLREIETGPTRAGSGEISCRISTNAAGSGRREQLAANRVPTQTKPTSHLLGLLSPRLV